MVLLDDKQLHFFDTTYDSFFDRQELFNKQKQAAYEKQQKWIRQAKSRLKYLLFARLRHISAAVL